MNDIWSSIPEYINKIVPYKAGKSIDELAREKNLTQISKLASNENPFGTPPELLNLDSVGTDELGRYPDMYAYNLKKALGEHYQLPENKFVVGSGSESILSNLMKCFVKEKTEVLTTTPTFIGLPILIQIAGGILKEVPFDDGFKYNAKKIFNQITNNTKVFYLANPNNPTGTFLKKKDFEYLIQNIPSNILIVIDEAYFEFAKDHPDYPDSLQYQQENIITLRTFSKAYGLAGARVGYGIACEKLIEVLHKVKLPFEPNTIAQHWAKNALTHTSHLEKTLKNNKKQYDKTFSFLKKFNLNPTPSVANFIMFETANREASTWLFEKLLDQGVIVRPLLTNGLPQHIRVSLGTSQEMDHFFKAMETIYPDYKKNFL